ncbi:MAG TPA: MarC family protein [Pyrinomonadaceae bacterium]|nr:MarC family protein [Pyrinomonadaceae bacterium]HMP64486.1 MarC family protein [Pyrinomonadaceae bacterium]
MTTISAALLLFLVMDPLGNIPLFMTTLKKVDEARQRFVVVRELLIALAVLVGFLFLGQYLLGLLQLSETALTTAGGIILMIIALKMIFPRRDSSLEEEVEGEPFIVPLAIPYVAGPSAMATALLLMSREPGRWPEWLLAVFIAWFASAVIIYFSGYFARFLGEKGMVAVERLMGMLLITVAVQMLLNGIGEFINASRNAPL